MARAPISAPTSRASRNGRNDLHFRELVAANGFRSVRGIISKHRSPGNTRRTLRGGSDKRLHGAVHRVATQNRRRSGRCRQRFLRNPTLLLLLLLLLLRLLLWVLLFLVERKELIGDVELLGVFEEELKKKGHKASTFPITRSMMRFL